MKVKDAQRAKLYWSFALFGFATGIIALRAESLTAAGLILTLVAGGIYRRSKALVTSAVALVAFSVIGLHPGRLYGFDTHSAAIIAQQISQHGWPVADDLLLPFSYPQTPVIHFLAAITSSITALQIVPDATNQAVVGQLLAVALFSFIVLFVYLIGREVVPADPLLPFLAIIAWVPLFMWKLAFRRQAIGFVSFAAVVWLITRARRADRSRRYGAAATLLAALTVVTHHLTAVMTGVILTSSAVIAGVSRGAILSHVRSWRRLSIGSVLVFVVWAAYFVLYGERFPLLVSGILHKLIIFARDGLTIGGTPPEWLAAHIVTPSVLRVVRFRLKFVVVGVLAMGVIAGVVTELSEDEKISPTTAFGVVTGAVIVPFTMIGIFHGVLDPIRMMTYWVVAGGAVSVACWQSVGRRLGRQRLVSGVVVVILICGAVMVPTYVIDQSPNYNIGQKPETMPDSMTAVAGFTDSFVPNDKVYGDVKTREAVSARSQVLVVPGFRQFLTGGYDGGTVVILADRNKHIYFGWFAGEDFVSVVTVRSTKPYQKLRSVQHVVYNNGGVDVVVVSESDNQNRSVNG